MLSVRNLLSCLLLALFLALDHDHGQETQDDNQTKDQENTWDADRVLPMREISVEKVGLVNKGLGIK
jgi:hypothetical protein